MRDYICLCRGIVRVCVTGYAPERFLNLCQKNGIQLMNITPVFKGFEMDMKKSDFFCVKPYLKKTGTKIKILQKVGLPFVLFRYRKHICFPLGILTALVFLFVMAQFLWEIEILGNDYITDYHLLNYLQKEEIGIGLPLRKISCEELEEQIRNDYPNIAWISIRLEGTRMIVDLQEVKTDNKSNMDTEHTYGSERSDLIASKSGIVTSIITRDGTPLVKVGEQVEMDQVLISGCMELYDDYGTVIDYQYCDANGDIVIAFTENYVDTIPRFYEKSLKTGKTRKGIQIRFPKGRITLGMLHPSYDAWESYTNEWQLVLGNKFIFPIVIQEICIYELSVENCQYKQEEIEDLAKKHFALYSKKMDKKGFQIVNKDGKIKVNDEIIQVLGTIDFQYLEEKRQTTKERSLDSEEGTKQNGFNTDSNGNSS